MAITHISSKAHLDEILSKSNDKITIIDFHATWCGPCHMIAPSFEAFSKDYKDVNFLKCDVDAAQEVAQKYKISAMPTFIFLKGTEQIELVRGANKALLEQMLDKHAALPKLGGDKPSTVVEAKSAGADKPSTVVEAKSAVADKPPTVVEAKSVAADKPSSGL